MNDILETVLIKTKNGPVRINKLDYNPDKDQLVTDEGKKTDDPDKDQLVTDEGKKTDDPDKATIPPVDPAAPPAPAAPVAPAAPAPAPAAPPAPAGEAFVAKDGDKWVIADKNGKSLDGVQYDTKKAATDAMDARNAG